MTYPLIHARHRVACSILAGLCLVAALLFWRAPVMAAPGSWPERLQTYPAESQSGDDMNGAGLRQPLPAGVRLLRDVAYGPDARQRFDVYLPARAQGGAPVVFMVHGGAWRLGDKAHAPVVHNKVAHWAPLGVVLVSVNYRLLPEAGPLQQAQDVARALAAAQRLAAGWGADPQRFVAMGHSAGAHLVALLAAAPALLQAQGAQPVRGTVALDSAALDVVVIMQSRHLPLYDQAFGSDPAFWRAASPPHQLQQAAAPLLAVCSSRPD